MPTDSNARQRIDELRDLLHRANHAYYVDGESLMSDRDFDERLRELIALEEAHPALHDPNSPTQRVGGQPIDGFETVAHTLPMQSIDNTYSEADSARVARSRHDSACRRIRGRRWALCRCGCHVHLRPEGGWCCHLPAI